MTTSRNILFLAALSGSLLLAQPPENRPIIVARLLGAPLLSPEEVANLESHVQANPDDLDGRLTLLRFYADSAPFAAGDPSRRIVRLRHILYLIDHHPGAPVSGMPVSYVSRSTGPYADEGDHLTVRNRWFAAVEAHPGDTRVILNTVRFLAVENKSDAEDLLERTIARYPENREIAANLGFLYAMEILGLDSLGFGASPSTARPDPASHARSELERVSNPFVLAGAGTALPNLAMGASRGGPVDPALFDLASSLATRARRLAPGDVEIQGPMPMIGYFTNAREGQVREQQSSGGSAAATPERIRIGGNVQAAALVRQTQPRYPELARNAGITGAVRFSAVIARDGTIQSLQVISGHPLLVPSALDAAKSWVYKPTLLNGVPVEVTTEITVSYP